MQKVIALTGASGNMGVETLRQILELDCVKKVRLLLVDERRERRYAKQWKQRYKDRVEIFFGDVADKNDCKKLVEGSDYVLHLAAIIPPKSDHHAQETDACNRVGTMNLVDAVCAIRENQPAFVHISTVAIYGDRNYKHPWGRVGDPLLPSVFDEYAASKIKGERYVLDSDLSRWVVLRQTGILHNNLLFDNIGDGLMFHTCFNTPIEWVTAKDSGLMMKHLVEKDVAGTLADSFWKKCYNVGGGKDCRITGFETFDRGFRMIGGSTEGFMRPDWNATRNFHCMWFEDNKDLHAALDFQRQSAENYWKEVENRHKYFVLAKILPPRLISALVIKPLLRNDNAPTYWLRHGMESRVFAAFGSEEAARALPTNWSDFNMLCKGKNPDDGSPLDYDEIRDESGIARRGHRLDHGYDESKADNELDLRDAKQAATFRGGECLSEQMEKGDLYRKLTWRCADGHTFRSSAYTILKAGHWCPECGHPQPWDFDRLAKGNPFYAQVWYDSHRRDEDSEYWFDENHEPQRRITR